MTHILRIDTSIKGENSVSAGLLDRITARLTAQGGATVTTRDISAGMPLIDGGWIGAAFTPEADRDPGQHEALALADTLLAEVQAADVLVIGLPIYNFGVPAQLKSWFDHLARNGLTFRYTEAGPEGLIKGKRAIIALSSDGTRLGSEVDFASGWVRHMLGFFGITDVRFVAADAILFDREGAMNRAGEQVEALAA
ncbi:MAG: NAD(P)H-dependent oxidoreductase [Gemmobacter sp.]